MDNPITLQEAKDQVAKKDGYKSFEDARTGGFAGSDELLQMTEEAAKLWNLSERKRTWDEACEAQMKEVYKHILPGQSTNAHAIQHWTQKPEFKP